MICKFKNFSYKRRFVVTAIVIFAIFTILAWLLQYEREKQYHLDKLEEQLSIYTSTIANFISTTDADNEKLSQFIKHLSDSTIRITVIDCNGMVSFDSEISAPEVLSNHLDRPEISEANRNGVGDNLRQSSTTGKSYYYYARKVNGYFVRCAVPYSLSIETVLETNRFLIYYYVSMFMIILIFIIYLSHLYSRIQDANKQLTTEKDKIYQHLLITNEGVAIFTSDKKEIISNEYFSQYINTISSSQLSNFSNIFKIKEFDFINKYIDEHHVVSATNGKLPSKSFTINKNNKTFIINVIIFNDNSFEISISDVTARIEQEDLKKQLTQNIAHELKTPVSSIQGFMETIINNPSLPADKQRFFIERSYNQAIRLSNLVSDIALLNKIEGTTTSLKQEPIAIRELFQSIIADVSLQIDEKNVHVSNMIKGQITVLGDRSLLYSAIRNLVDNSLLYAGNHFNITINCYREDETHYYFSYYDTGIGIEENHFTRIFDRFYRIDEGRSRKVGGTGLGLSIVKNAITLHKGTISAKRHEGGGLEFIFTLAK